jgi:hypothetical protein
MPVTQEQIRAVATEIQRAKAAAALIAKTAARRRGMDVRVDVIGGNAHSASEVTAHVAAKLAALAAITPAPFFCRVTATTQIDRKPLRETFLFSKARFPGTMDVEGSDDTLLSWTSPLYAFVRDARPESIVAMEGGRVPVRHKIHASSDWSLLLPEAEGILVRTPEADLVLARESELEIPGALRPFPIAGYSQGEATRDPQAAPVKQSYGLGEIIALADATQRTAMHLPFSEDVLVEGPPGSGKTSVGLMRIPCLLDRQWKELDLDPEKDRAFHTEESMRVLVMNAEMVPYLERLMRDISISRVPVETLGDYCRDICKRAGLQILTGIPRRCSPELDRVKFAPEGLEAFVSAIKSSVRDYWAEESVEIERKFRDVHMSLGTEAFRVLGSWVSHVAEWKTNTIEINPRLRIGQRLNNWAFHRLRENAPMDSGQLGFGESLTKQNEERGGAREAIRRISSMCNTVLKQMLERKRITDRLESSEALTPELLREWQSQASRRGDVAATCSDGDYALHGLITALFLLSNVPDDEKALVGARLPRLTHAAIDEAQDIAPVHVLLLRYMLADNGTLTLVGDLRQRIDGAGHFQTWTQLPLRNPKHAVFSVNHRQTKPIGDFVRDEHYRLYREAATWEPSKRSGPPVRRCTAGPPSLGDVVGSDVLRWLREFPDCSCGVLFAEDYSPELLSKLRDDVEAALHDELVTVDLALADSSERQLRKESGVILAPVGLTKGLEFDVVVLVSPQSLTSEIDRNRHYVGCSRARTGLTVVTTEG